MADQSIIRIHRELRDFARNGDLSIAAAYKDEDIRKVRTLIVGPPETPYEFGLFEFNVKFSKEYPTKAPSVIAITTNYGRTRFNPNIYATGKVCLSILGTWRGERGEEWSSAQGLESILLSIQSLMSANPYENEPGFEGLTSADEKEEASLYAAKIRHETLRISIIERMEDYLKIPRSTTRLITSPDTPASTINATSEDWESTRDSDGLWDPHKDKCKLRFLWYYDSYHRTVDEEAQKYKDGEKFVNTGFESTGNTMDGSFQYEKLRSRLKVIKEKLDAEVEMWAVQGKKAVERELGVANNLKCQFEQTTELYQNTDIPIDIELVHDNPFVWELTLVGRLNTQLDGGVVKAKMNLSPTFPKELPRVRIETPLFHQRVSKSGTLCYSLKNTDSGNLASHVQAIIDVLEDVDQAYDPRTRVNPEAFNLLWGTEEQKEEYRQRLERTVQRSWDHI